MTSNPSVPTDDEHPPAQLRVSEFSPLANLPKLPYPKTNIWNQVVDDNTLGGYSNESNVINHVERVINDILEAMGIQESVVIRGEIEIMRNRPDFMLIIVNGYPIGTIKGKQPGGVAMHHPNILGEVYDQFMHLQSIFRINKPFAILTSYEEWRICWLDDNDLAAANTLPAITPYKTPVKQKSEISEDVLEEDGSSPLPPPTPSRTIGVCNLPEDDETDDEGEISEDDQQRVILGTEVIQWNDKSLPVMLESVIRKMMASQQLAYPAVLRVANTQMSFWKNTPPQTNLNFKLCIGTAVKKNSSGKISGMVLPARHSWFLEVQKGLLES